ncbi:MAG: tetratricopeptide repeat-containing protein [Rhodobacteraceae bacterium CG17_big_fil_post_rev_8_21_14_2_50_63_15]|nr:tetratricopeptide repeat protein [Roseovarius sp.]PIV78406.1 MAG: tetratricopeptide repeat-containing protein [Rhodobacteraceae bacterium CG17_big_fil_post_rev_8_21_14_2_50_63_15]
MGTDQFGYETTVSSPAAAAAWDNTVLAFLAHGARTPEYLGRTLSEEPDFAMGHATKGLFLLMLGRRELTATAQDSYAMALAAADRVAPTAREMGYVRALGAWLDGRPSGTVQEMEAILACWPEDALAMKMSHATRFILGDGKGMRASVEALLPAYDAKNPACGYLLGCHAFCLEETGEYGRAETAGRLGLSLAPDDAWGLHAVAHVFDMTANARAGLNWLEGREGAWAHCNNFRYHVWWHKALMHLDQGEIDAVFHLYDTEVRRDHTDDFRDISNGAAMLMRLELEGIDVGDRWEEMAEISERRTEDACLIFADLHYLMALVGGQRDVAIKRMMGRLHRDAKQSSVSEMTARMANPGLSAATGLEAFGAGDYKTAFLNLGRARRSMQLVGGSHAQRDVFERLTIDSAIRGGFLHEAESILRERTTQRSGRLDAYASSRLDLIADSQGDWKEVGRLPAE